MAGQSGRKLYLSAGRVVSVHAVASQVYDRAPVLHVVDMTAKEENNLA
jgi:hypothetical protein